jgi:hypothetical protein
MMPSINLGSQDTHHTIPDILTIHHIHIFLFLLEAAFYSNIIAVVAVPITKSIAEPRARAWQLP